MSLKSSMFTKLLQQRVSVILRNFIVMRIRIERESICLS